MIVTKVTSSLTYPITIHTNDCPEHESIVLLLHGYSEEGTTIFQRLSPHLDHQRQLIVAPDGLFPLIRRFPLDAREKDEKLLRGYAWYFYDAATDHYLIDYDVPAGALASLLSQLNPNHKPVTIIGYSQGGYLAPFVAAKYPHCQYVVGVNCSYRYDLYPQSFWDKNIVVDAIQGADDPMIDVGKAQERHSHLRGRFHLVADENHHLSPRLSQLVAQLISPGLSTN